MRSCAPKARAVIKLDVRSMRLLRAACLDARPGEGVIKRSLPDAHADFVYAVGAEEFGLIASLGLIVLFGALAFRGLSRAARLNDPYEQLAATGLVTLLVAQAVDPHRGQSQPHSRQGHDATLHFVWRIVDDRLGAGAWLLFASLLRNRPGAFLYSGRAR